MKFQGGISGYFPATLAGIGAILLWASNIAFSRSVMEKEGSLNAAFCIYIYSGIFLYLLLLVFQPAALRRKNESVPLFFRLKTGLFFILNNVLLFIAVGMAARNEELVIVSLLNYTWPVLVYLTGIPVLGLKMPAGTLIAGTFLALAGIALALFQGYDIEGVNRILRAGDDNILAYSIAFLTALSWALYSNMTSKYKASGDLASIPAVFIISGLVFLLIIIFRGELSSLRPFAPFSNPELVFVIIGPTALGYLGWYIAIKRGNRNLVTSLSFFIPLLSLLITHFKFDIPIGLLFWLSAGMLITGSWMFYRQGRVQP